MNSTANATAADIRRANGALAEALSALQDAKDAVAAAYSAVSVLPDAELVSQRRDLSWATDIYAMLIKAIAILPDSVN